MLTSILITLSFLTLLAAPAPQAAPVRALDGQQLAQVRIQQHVVIRVPSVRTARTPVSAAPPPPPIVWVEKRADNCVRVDKLAGAAITRADSVDLVLAGGKRLRAKLGNQCPALDFYRGFYVKPSDDGKLCARRDVIRSRSGGECRIEAFRKLVPDD